MDGGTSCDHHNLSNPTAPVKHEAPKMLFAVLLCIPWHFIGWALF